MESGRTTLLAALLVAAGTSPAATNPDEKGQLLQLLDQQTRIATKTRLNADYVPGILSVLHGQDLENRGVRTVWEALELVPGVAVVIDHAGRRQLIIRGIGKVYASGNVRILLNGVSVNDETLGLADPVLNIAIEQVKRIEVIRGPGSAIYGGYATAGVLNIITRSEGSRVFARGGSFDTRGGGVLVSTEGDPDDWHATLNLAYGESEGAGSEVERDILYDDALSLEEYSYAPGPANDKRRDGTGVLQLSRGGFTLLGQWSESSLGDHFGSNLVLPPPESRLVEHNRLQTVELRQAFPWSSGELSFHLGHKRIEKERDGFYLGPAAYFDPAAAAPFQPVSGALLRKERQSYVGVDLSWTGLARHGILLSLGHNLAEVTASSAAYNLLPGPSPQPTEAMVAYPSYPSTGTERKITSLTLQDEYRASEAFTITTGLRYDDYSDVGSRTTPRLAAVWRMSDTHILKAQYARAFRPPTLFESSIREDNGYTEEVEPAIVDTAELGYIYKGDRHDARITFYHSRLDSLVVFQPFGFANDEARSMGVELEYSGRLSRTLRLDGNVAYSRTEDDSADGDPIAGTPLWTGNLGMQYRVAPSAILSLQYRAVGPFSREPEDPRDSTDPYETLDMTLSLENLVGSGASLRAGVKNALDSKVRHPAVLAPTSDRESVIVAYPDDLPRPGREWWVQLGYAF